MRFGLTPDRPCDYLPDAWSRVLMVIDEQSITPALYDHLLEQGFRRSGPHVYRPWCRTCRRCVPVRLPAADHHPARWQRRLLRRNADLTIRWVRTERLDEEQWQLYHAYLEARHGNGDMVRAGRAESDDFLFNPQLHTELLELRLDHQLLAVAVTDVQPRSLSALYTFFHPEHARRSLGSLAILLQLERARQLERPWLYLGYWIGACRKMRYKGRFTPLEVLRPEPLPMMEHWRRLDTPEAARAFDVALEADTGRFFRPDPEPEPEEE